MARYYTSINNSSTFNLSDIDNTYTRITGDDRCATVTLNSPFNFNNINYTTMYPSTNGMINFTKVYNDLEPNINENSQLVGFFFPQTDIFFSDSATYGMYYRESNNIFTVIYNGYYIDQSSNLYQLKVNLYLSGHFKSGTVEYNYGVINNSDKSSVLGFSFGTSNTANFIQDTNLLIPQVFVYPYCPYVNITNSQSNYTNKQLSIIPYQNSTQPIQNNSFVGFSSNKSKQVVRKRINKIIDNL